MSSNQLQHRFVSVVNNVTVTAAAMNAHSLGPGEVVDSEYAAGADAWKVANTKEANEPDQISI